MKRWMAVAMVLLALCTMAMGQNVVYASMDDLEQSVSYAGDGSGDEGGAGDGSGDSDDGGDSGGDKGGECD
jgi:hypothetical protein